MKLSVFFAKIKNTEGMDRKGEVSVVVDIDFNNIHYQTLQRPVRDLGKLGEEAGFVLDTNNHWMRIRMFYNGRVGAKSVINLAAFEIDKTILLKLRLESKRGFEPRLCMKIHFDTVGARPFSAPMGSFDESVLFDRLEEAVRNVLKQLPPDLVQRVADPSFVRAVLQYAENSSPE